MLYRSLLARISVNYVRNSNLIQFNYLKRYDFAVINFAIDKFLTNFRRFFGRFSTTKMSNDLNVFNGTVDRYNGITIDTDSEAICDEFAEKLKSM